MDEIAAWREYDYVIVNRHLDEAVRQLACIIEAERCRTSRLTLNLPDLPVGGGPGDPSRRRRMMSFPSLEKCLEQISNRYVLVVLAAKRSRQLNRGAQPQVETKRRKWTSVALEEASPARSS